MFLAVLVVLQRLLLDGGENDFPGNDPLVRFQIHDQGGGGLQVVQQRPGVAVGGPDNQLPGRRGQD